MYVLISLYLPSPRRLIFGVDKNSGRIRKADASITFLPPHQFYRMVFEKRTGQAQRDGAVRINSKEGVPVTMTYRIRFDIAAQRLADARRLVRDGWSAWIRARVAEAVQAVTSQVPIEDLLSPSSAFSARRQPLRDAVARHLKASGLEVTAFEIQRMEVDREALLAYKRAELRRNARVTIGRMAVFAIDGADWELLTELMIDNRLPNIEAMARSGVTATVQTIQPTLAPLLWTTTATGLPPDRHAVIDFFDREMRSPVSSRSRHAPAVWDIGAAFGRSSAVVNWWTSWPPTTPSGFTFDTPVVNLDEAVHPPSFEPRVDQIAVPELTIGFDQIRRFLNVTANEFQNAAVARAATDPISLFRRVLAKTWTDHRVAIDYFQSVKPNLVMVNFEGADTVNHLFAPYHPPLRNGVDAGEYRKYWPVVANYYSEIDRLIGEWTKVLPQDTTVLIVSAHGFHWGEDRPRMPPAGMSAFSAHRDPGVLVLFGSRVAASPRRLSVSLYDIAPTILALLGLPPSQEMPGKPALAMLRDVEVIDDVPIVSYGDLVEDRPAISRVHVDPRQYRVNLQAIGHLADPARQRGPLLTEQQQSRPAASPLSPESWGLYAYYNNLGVQLKQNKQLAEAAAAFAKAIELNPARSTPYHNLIQVLLERQQYSGAEAVLREAVQRGMTDAEQRYLDLAAFYRQNNMLTRAIAVLTEARELFPYSVRIAANLGSALAEMNRYTESLTELERALALQPSSTLVLNNLGMIYSKKQDYSRALDFWNRSLSIEPRQPRIREAVSAVQTHL